MIRIGLVLLMSLVMPDGTGAQEVTGRIEGNVVTADTGQPLVGASIEVTGAAIAKKRGGIGDDEGHFSVGNLPPGKYALTVSFVGYLKHKSNIEVVADKTIQLHIEMEEAPYQLAETVVAASRREESIIDAPASIEKITAREIQKNAGVSSYAAMIKNAKGIDYFQNGVLGEAVNARGFNSAWGYRLFSLVDGRVTTMPSGTLPMSAITPVTKDDIQDIEVITGPGSALYGPDAISGVISITTKDPRHAQGTSVALAGGERSTLKSRFYHAQQRGQWAWKLTGDYHKARDYELTNTFFNADSTVSITDDPDFDASVLRGGLGLYYYPSDESRWALSAGGSRLNSINLTSVGRWQTDDAIYHFQQLTYTSPKWYLNVYRNGDDFGDSYVLDSKVGALLAGLSEADAKDRAALAVSSAMWEAEGRYHFSLPPLRDTRFIIGTNFRQVRPGGSLDGVEPINLTGLYGQSETDLSRPLKLVLTARLDQHEIYDTQFSPRAALIYKPRPEWALRATFNRAFLSPTLTHQVLLVRINDLVTARGNSQGYRFVNLSGDPLPPAYAAGIAKLKPEQSNTFELGFKGVLGNRIFLDISGYRSRYKDFISPLQVVNDLAQGIVIVDEEGNPRQEVTLTYVNFGEQTVQGLDVGINAYLNDYIEARGSMSLIDANALETTRNIDQPFNTPSATYKLGLTARDLLSRGTDLDLGLRHITEFYFRSGVHVGTVPAYTVADLSLGYQTKYGVVYRLSVNNILDNKHREFVTGPKIGRIAITEVQYAF